MLLYNKSTGKVSGMIQIGINCDDEIANRINEFVTEIDNVVFRQNHAYKYEGERDIIKILNYINLRLKLHFSFINTEDGVYISNPNMKFEVIHLPAILKIFKRIYRFKMDYKEEYDHKIFQY